MKEQKAPKIHSVQFNFIMNAILTVSSFVFPMITFPYASRVLLVENYGKVTFATSVLTYFAMFAALGIPNYGIRACARVRDDKVKLSRTAQELMIINLITSAITYVAFFVSLIFVKRFQQDCAIYLTDYQQRFDSPQHARRNVAVFGTGAVFLHHGTQYCVQNRFYYIDVHFRTQSVRLCDLRCHCDGGVGRVESAELPESAEMHHFKAARELSFQAAFEADFHFLRDLGRHQCIHQS